MRTVQRGATSGPAAGLLAALVLLGVLAATVGLSRAGVVAAVATALAGTGLLHLALVRDRAPGLRPGDRVTVSRAVLVIGVVALTIDPLPGPVATTVLLASVALALDAVDGQVARRTSTASALGARLDMEVDAFLVLVLSWSVAGQVGAWVLLIGLARYALLAATVAVPWLGDEIPPRRWAKAVAAFQGIALVVAVSGALPQPATVAVLLVAIGLLAASFGHQVVWLRRHRQAPPAVAGHPAPVEVSR